MRSSTVKDIVGLSFGVALSLIFGEWVARVLVLAPLVNKIVIDTPYAQFESSENMILKYVPKAGSHDVNSYGIRDHDYSKEKPPQTFRIIVLGDSIGFGFCTNDESLPIESTFAHHLEERLNSYYIPDIRRFEVINLSVSGYNTVQEVEFFFYKGLVLAPDLVIVAYCLNDAWTASAELDRLKDAGWLEFPALLPKIFSTIFQTSHLARFVWQRYSILRSHVQKTADTDSPAVGLKRLRELADSHNFDAMITIFPLFEDFDHYSYHPEHERARKEAMRNRFDVLDLFDAFHARSRGNSKALQGRCNREHPDEKGHLVAAGMLEKYVVAKLSQAYGQSQ